MRLLTAALKIGDRLCELVIQHEEGAHWIGLKLVHGRAWTLAPAGLDLYSGQPGIILFLAYLGQVTGKQKYTSLARLATQTLFNEIDTLKVQRWEIGAFEGWSSLIYMYTHLSVLWQDSAYLEKAEELAFHLAPLIAQDKYLDIIRGAAGAIRVLLNLYTVIHSSGVIDLARRCGDHLLTQAKKMPQGIAWHTSSEQERPLTGFSHGTAGIALSLFQLAFYTGDERYQQAALAAMNYDRSVFSPTLKNWPDYRDLEADDLPTSSQDVIAMTTWCHGAPGIGLARLGSLAYYDDLAMRQDITIALQTTLERGFGQNHSLCHGDMGNIEIVLVASQQFPTSDYRQSLEEITAMIVASIESHGWYTGVPMNVETPGLMTGIAGIGYGLLRLATPDQVPSILLLDAPHYQIELDK
jgi:type 2 lantibiotic biosynthesis protein LanM